MCQFTVTTSIQFNNMPIYLIVRLYLNNTSIWLAFGKYLRGMGKANLSGWEVMRVFFMWRCFSSLYYCILYINTCIIRYVFDRLTWNGIGESFWMWGDEGVLNVAPLQLIVVLHITCIIRYVFDRLTWNGIGESFWMWGDEGVLNVAPLQLIIVLHIIWNLYYKICVCQTYVEWDRRIFLDVRWWGCSLCGAALHHVLLK